MKARPGEARVCKGDSKEHSDALAVVEFLMEQGGYTPLSNPDVAVELGFVNRRGKNLEVDVGRYYRARNHVRDRVWEDGKPCCSYTLHYRTIKGSEQLALIDPTGTLGEHAVASVSQLRGWMTRERQHQTENTRQMRTLDTLASHALARGDKDGYRLCVRAGIDIEEYGTIRPPLLAELDIWATSIRS
jgi:hypothetical protein